MPSSLFRFTGLVGYLFVCLFIGILSSFQDLFSYIWGKHFPFSLLKTIILSFLFKILIQCVLSHFSFTNLLPDPPRLPLPRPLPLPTSPIMYPWVSGAQYLWPLSHLPQHGIMWYRNMFSHLKQAFCQATVGILGLDSPPSQQGLPRLHIWAPGLAALPAREVIALLWGEGWHHHLFTAKTPVPFSPLSHLRGLKVVYFEPMKHSNYTQIIAPFLTTLLTHPVMAFCHDALQHFQRLAVSVTS